jgi:hypothetical protein
LAFRPPKFDGDGNSRGRRLSRDASLLAEIEISPTLSARADEVIE